MIIDEINQLLARALGEQRRSTLTGPQLKQLFLSLPDPAWNKLAGYFVANDAKALGDFQLQGVKNLIHNQAMAEVNAVTADGTITAQEIANLLGPSA